MPEKIKQTWKDEAKSILREDLGLDQSGEEFVRGIVPTRQKKNKCRTVISYEEQARQPLLVSIKKDVERAKNFDINPHKSVSANMIPAKKTKFGPFRGIRRM